MCVEENGIKVFFVNLKYSYAVLPHFKILLFFISLNLICGQSVNTMSSFLTLFIHLKQTMLYSVWDANSRMCDNMVMKRSYVQRLRQEVKLGIVLKEQVSYVDCFLHV